MDINKRADVYLNIILPSSLGKPAKIVAAHFYLGDQNVVLKQSYADIQKATGLSKSGVTKGINELDEKLLIERRFDRNIYKNVYSIPSIFMSE